LIIYGKKAKKKSAKSNDAKKRIQMPLVAYVCWCTWEHGTYPVCDNSMACCNGTGSQHSLGMVFGGSGCAQGIIFHEVQVLEKVKPGKILHFDFLIKEGKRKG
jgi:hypothetical protein